MKLGRTYGLEGLAEELYRRDGEAESSDSQNYPQRPRITNLIISDGLQELVICYEDELPEGLREGVDVLSDHEKRRIEDPSGELIGVEIKDYPREGMETVAAYEEKTREHEVREGPESTFLKENFRLRWFPPEQGDSESFLLDMNPAEILESKMKSKGYEFLNNVDPKTVTFEGDTEYISQIRSNECEGFSKKRIKEEYKKLDTFDFEEVKVLDDAFGPDGRRVDRLVSVWVKRAGK